MLAAFPGPALTASTRKDLVEWSGACVLDRLIQHFNVLSRDEGVARLLARAQWSVWTSLLMDLPHQAAFSRRDLERMAGGACPKSPGAIDAGDEIVIEELASIIFNRFRRSPSSGKDYTVLLAFTAKALGVMQNSRKAEDTPPNRP